MLYQANTGAREPQRVIVMIDRLRLLLFSEMNTFHKITAIPVANGKMSTQSPAYTSDGIVSENPMLATATKHVDVDMRHVRSVLT